MKSPTPSKVTIQIDQREDNILYASLMIYYQ